MSYLEEYEEEAGAAEIPVIRESLLDRSWITIADWERILAARTGEFNFILYAQSGIDLGLGWLARHPPYHNYSSGRGLYQVPEITESSCELRLQVAPPPVCHPAGVYLIWAAASTNWVGATELQFGHYWIPQLTREQLRQTPAPRRTAVTHAAQE